MEQKELEKLTIEIAVKAFYRSCQECAAFSEQVMIPALTRKENPGQKEKLVLGIYRNMHCWMKAVPLLDSEVFFQTTATAARSIFESALDIELIIHDRIPDIEKRFNQFLKLERFRILEEFADFQAKHPTIKSNRISPRRVETALNKNLEKEMDALATLWQKPRKEIRHWSGLTVKQRARQAGRQFEMFYYESFGLLSIYVHSGLAGIVNMDEEGLRAVYGNSLSLLFDMFVTVIYSVGGQFGFYATVPDFKERLKKLASMPGEIILEENKKYSV